MKNKKAAIIPLVAIAAILAVAAICFATAYAQTKITGVTIREIPVMKKGTVTQAEYAKEYTVPDWLPPVVTDKLVEMKIQSVPVVWSAADNAIISPDKNGMLTAMADGTTSVTVTVGNATASQDVTVETEIISLSADEEVLVTEDGSDTQNVNAVIVPATAADTLTYSVEDPSVATVDAAGNVTGVSEGETTITVSTASGLSATVHIVSNYFASSISILDSVTMNVGDTGSLGYSILPETPTGTHWRSDVMWETSDPSVVAVFPMEGDDGCMLYAVGKGTCTVAAGVQSKGIIMDTCEVTVK